MFLNILNNNYTLNKVELALTDDLTLVLITGMESVYRFSFSNIFGVHF